MCNRSIRMYFYTDFVSFIFVRGAFGRLCRARPTNRIVITNFGDVLAFYGRGVLYPRVFSGAPGNGNPCHRAGYRTVRPHGVHLLFGGNYGTNGA